MRDLAAKAKKAADLIKTLAESTEVIAEMIEDTNILDTSDETPSKLDVNAINTDELPLTEDKLVQSPLEIQSTTNVTSASLALEEGIGEPKNGKKCLTKCLTESERYDRDNE